MQGAVFVYLRSMLLSDFMFPFQGMPGWAQALGEVLPLTLFVRAARAALLKGQDGSIVVHEYGRSDFSGSWPQRSRLPLTAAASTDYFHELRSKSPSASRHSLGLKSAFQIDKSGLMWHTIAILAFLPLRPS